MSRSHGLLAVVVGLCVSVLMSASPAAAHPLGNFSINHLDMLTFRTDRIIDRAIVDTAEIPTAQAQTAIDANGDGTESVDELAQYGSKQCEAYRRTLSLAVDGTPREFTTTSASFEYRSGQAGLRTTRLECEFDAFVDLAAPGAVRFGNDFAPNRVGWHEIVATGVGTNLLDSPVPATSVTDGLTVYPVDLLSSPLDIRSAAFQVAPGEGARPAFRAKAAEPSVFSSAFGPMSRAVERVSLAFNDLVGRRQLTFGVGLLAIGLALVLGASHALLPGHGKTVMAAYIAGRQGSVRDAVLVGATVTATHTGGVLLLGLALTLSTSLAGESVLGWLGVFSGLLIAVLGFSLLRGAIRHRPVGHGHRHGPHGHNHGPHGHDHDHDGHGHDHDHDVHGHDHDGHGHDGHGHGHGHDHDHGHGHGGHDHDVNVYAPPRVLAYAYSGPSVSVGVGLLPVAVAGDAPFAAVAAGTGFAARKEHFPKAKERSGIVSRRGLVGMGIAGGLVPSPSALVVLLSAIALGRTVFGIVLVIGYGVGMAGTLTIAGVILVRVRDRFQHRLSSEPERLRGAAVRWLRLAPYLTAGLVLVVGLGLALRSLSSV